MMTGFVGYARAGVTHLVMTQRKYCCATDAHYLGNDAMALTAEHDHPLVVVDLQVVDYG